MKIKKIVAILIITILINSNFVFAITTNEANNMLPNEKPVINIEEKNETDNKIKKENIEKNKRANTVSTNTVNTKKSKRMLKSAQIEDKYKGECIPGRDDLCDIFVSRDGKHYTYTLGLADSTKVSIDRYCFETKETTRVYSDNNIVIPSFYFTIQNNIVVKGTTIYYSAFSKTDENHLQIYGYDAQTEKIVYSNTFEISKENYNNSFCVDKNKNICIATKGKNENVVRIGFYDKDGKLISEATKEMLSKFYCVKMIYMNDKIIWAKAFIEDNGWLRAEDISIRIENGVIMEEYNSVENYGMEFNFLNDEETMAYDQYGDIIQFKYNGGSVQISELSTITIGNQRISLTCKNSSDNNYIYAGANNGIILEYNWNTHELKRAISIGKDKVIAGVFKGDDKLFIEYTDSNWNNVYALILDYSDFETPSQIVEITNHTTLNRTKDEIKEKYNELKIINKNNFNNANDEKPSTKAPYSAGTLNEQTRTDTLNQINYFRWLAGINEVSINDKYMEYAQSGAVLLKTSPQLMHKPPQPSDMTDEFYQKAVGATNAKIGVSMSANISQNSPIAESIQRYVDDVSNIEPNVGHRLSILDYRATSTSFGYAEGSGVVDMFLSWDATPKDDFTAWPSAGKFPIESINKQAMWSIGIDTSKYFNTNNLEIKIKANGKEYSSNNNDFTVHYDKNYASYYYAPPTELINYLTDGKNTIQENKEVEIELKGFADYYGNTCIIKYPIQFISVDEITYKKGDVNGDGKVTLIDYGLVLAHVKRTKLLTGEQLQRADVNGDKKVTLIDYGLILAHVKRTKLLF